jgi:hypothetical protein
MNPTDLIKPRCKLTGTTPVIRSTRHLFLDLPKLSEQLQQYIDTTSQLGGWSANCVQVCGLSLPLTMPGPDSSRAVRLPPPHMTWACSLTNRI